MGMEDIKTMILNKFPNLANLKKQAHVARRYKVNLYPCPLEFVHDVLFLMVKVQAVEFKPTLIMDQGSFRNQFFCPPTTEGFDEVKDFDFLGHSEVISPKYNRLGQKRIPDCNHGLQSLTRWD